MAKGIRNVELILYNIDEVYKCMAVCKKEGFDFAYIMHDKDLKEDLSDFKKMHYHFHIYAPNQKSFERWAKIFEINLARVQMIDNKAKAIRYLIHADNQDKFQYDIDNIQCNFEIIKYFNNLISDETNEVDLLFTYIDYMQRTITLTELRRYAIENNIWSTFRRNYVILRDAIQEHNIYLTKRDY